MNDNTPGWTDLSDIVSLLRKRWDRGTYARALCGAYPWEPVGVPLRGPTAADVLHRLDDVRRWSDRWHRESRSDTRQPRLRTEYRSVKSRSLGENRLPAKAWVDTPDQLCALIGTLDKRRALEQAVQMTVSSQPSLLPWVQEHPMDTISNFAVWPQALATVGWIADHDTAELYLRQLDLDGIDTKFVERNYKLLERLLAHVSPERVDRFATDPAVRLGFRAKPYYVRIRFLGSQPAWPPGLTEVRVRADELASVGTRGPNVFIVENEISYLAFPTVDDSIVMFGSGYALEPANTGEWLKDRRVVYWGDIDTHGFAILDRLRQRYPEVVSVLMDAPTLLAHRSQWVNEATPTSRALPHLTEPEAELYRDLVEDRYGRAVRLEQERVRFSLVTQAVRG